MGRSVTSAVLISDGHGDTKSTPLDETSIMYRVHVRQLTLKHNENGDSKPEAEFGIQTYSNKVLSRHRDILRRMLRR